MIKGLVSIITPCYNTAKYLPKLLDSILFQTYPMVEMYAVDDGSTDETPEIIDSYISKFKKKGYQLFHLHQNNSGQSVAIQRGLELINGEYLVWPDSDDFYSSEQALTIMVNQFESKDSDVGIVRSQGTIVKDTDNHPLVKLVHSHHKNSNSLQLFEDCLFQKNKFYFIAGAYMVKVEALLNSTEFPIFTSYKAGQNWQLLLPILYHYKCSTVDTSLYNIVQRQNSHSRNYSTYNIAKCRILTYQETIIQTLKRIRGMPSIVAKKYEAQIISKYRVELLENAIIFNNKEEARYYFKTLHNDKILNSLEKIRYFLFLYGYKKLSHYVKAIEIRIGK